MLADTEVQYKWLRNQPKTFLKLHVDLFVYMVYNKSIKR